MYDYEKALAQVLLTQLLVKLHEDLLVFKRDINVFKEALDDLGLKGNDDLNHSDELIKFLDTGLKLVYTQLVTTNNPTDEPKGKRDAKLDEVGEEADRPGVSPD